MQTLKRTALSLSAAALCCLTALSSVSAGTFTAATQDDSQLLEYKVYAAQFLNMATFGASSSDIDALATRMKERGVGSAREEWIDQQFALPVSAHYALAKQIIGEYGLAETNSRTNAVRFQAWWHLAIAAPDQLRQRVAWALAQIWVTNGIGGRGFLGGTSYYDLLVRNSFGNYRDLMEDIALNPVMGVYLSHFRNRKANPALNQFPDENFARELLQLFTIGPLELRTNGDFETDANGNRIPSYGNQEITAFARVLTGLDSATSTKFGQGSLDPHRPMKMWDSAHDTDSKTLLRGGSLPANQTGMDDIRGGLDNVFGHPNLGPFVARLLIQRLVMSNPPKDYVERVAKVLNGDGGSQRGDMQALIKAILLDPEASPNVVKRTEPTIFHAESGNTSVSRLKEPVVRFAGLIRAFNPTSTCPKGRFILRQQTDVLTQGPYESPSVFNFYSPDFQPAGSLEAYRDTKLRDGIAVAPEFQIWTPIGLSRFSNYMMTTMRQERVLTTTLTGTNCAIMLNFTKEKQLAAKPADLVKHLDLLLCQGTMSDTSRNTIVEHITRESTSTTIRAQNAIIATMLAPECAISP